MKTPKKTRYCSDPPIILELYCKLFYCCDNFNTSTIKFEVRDAKKIHLPNERLAVFLFNPFGLDTMRMFLSNNIKLMHQNKSVMMYANDQFLDELLKFGTLDMRDDFFNLPVISF